MLNEFESLKNFKRALREVKILIWMIMKNENNPRYKMNPILKSSVILLVSKFESFLESTVEEYVYIINSKKLPKPDSLMITHTEERLAQLTNIKDIKSKTDLFKTLASLWNGREIDLNISNKFNFGKHGEKAINQLFSKIGFDEIISSIVIVEISNNYAEDNIKTPINVKEKLNEIINKRNNIIHEDASINFTPEEIKKYINYFYQFSVSLENILRIKLDTLNS